MYPQNPQPRPPQPKRHPVAVTITIIVVIFAGLLGFGSCAALVGGSDPSSSPEPTGAAPAATETQHARSHATPSDEPSDEPTHSAKPTHHAKPKVHFLVEGKAPNGVDITYGSDSDNRQGGSLPWGATLPLHDDALYYTVTAQLQGGGDITCTVQIGDKVKMGHASGSYNICSAQLNSDMFGGWS